MKNNLKYFGIYNEIDFKNKSENEQKELLIKSKIYIIGNSTEEFNKNEFDFVIQDDPNNYVTYLGKDFELKNKAYTLNDEFLEEIFTNIMQEFQVDTPQFIDAHLKRIKLNLETYRNEKEQTSYVDEVRQTAETQYRASLNSLLFAELHENKNPVDYILKKHLKNNFYQLSNYLFGLGKLDHFTIYNVLFQFEQMKSVLNFCLTFNPEGKDFGSEDIEFKKPSLPKAIAMLHEIGFFELEKIKKLTPKAIAQIIAIIQIKDPNNETVKRAISGNISVLNPDSQENFSKYTTHKNLDEIKSLYKEIKKGNC